tara:strand:+ start:593 stop:1174 length:582 start_codon:yes stop_codon:yes gene_type:complete
MSLSRRLKKIALRSEMISIDEQEYDDIDSKYSQQFNRDFEQEQKFLSRKPKVHILNVKDEDESSMPEAKYSIDIPQSVLKKIHRELIRKKHPDLNQTEEDHDDFKKIQKAYEQKDIGLLIEFAIKNNVDVELEEEHLNEIEKQLAEKEQELNEKKNTVRWIWCSSDKNADLRKQVRGTMGIKEEDYEEWKSKQ